jgi:hypothetical protein
MALTVLKKTPIHCVSAIHGSGGAETINLTTTLATAFQTPASPIVNISGLLWAVPAEEEATITRNSSVLWTLTGADNFSFLGYSDNRLNEHNIVVDIPTGATVIVECVKVAGYGDSQHLNQAYDVPPTTTTTAAP